MHVNACDANMTQKTPLGHHCFLRESRHIPGDIVFAFRGDVSPAQRQIGGDREQLEERKSQPAACCCLTLL